MSRAVDAEAFVAAAYDAVARGGHGALLDYFDADGALHFPDTLPFGGVYRGSQQIARGLDWQSAALGDTVMRVEQLTSWGDCVIAYLSICARGGTSGWSFAGPMAELWRLRDGKVIEKRTFHWDTHRLLRCLDVSTRSP